MSDPAAVPPAPAVTPTEADEPDQDLLVDFRGVSLRRDGRTLVGPIDWRVELDERWVVIGPNGAGKTSLMRLASAQVFPTEGTAHILGEVLGKTVVQDLTARIGVSTAALAARVPDDELVTDVVVSAGYAVLGRWRERYDAVDISRAVDVLESMGAEHLANRRFGTLSEGERKRVLISRALMTDPELMLLDEPAAGLDLGGREELVARLDTLARDPDAPATVLVTHHVEEIPPGFTHALLLKEGGVVAQGLIGDVLTAEVLSETFSQRILLDEVDGRYFARRASRPGRRRLQA
ncbi:ABC transporter ATP-binding protein [Tsukamurella spumae]|uniref:ABC transporter ATP-binding protein n=1 Tax=Tsukamurella spumae TaxID=44753 RepID=A0A846X332_9ACTN|nr:ABC transporter ATP-binding protein [Tsukamurella spumae]NKY19563.1 ABC transporter ATP-binding protein [Tsukamurella spumae]